MPGLQRGKEDTRLSPLYNPTNGHSLLQTPRPPPPMNDQNKTSPIEEKHFMEEQKLLNPFLKICTLDLHIRRENWW